MLHQRWPVLICHAMNSFMTKVNTCFPLVDEAHFRHQYQDAPQTISPALLACLYAHALAYWTSDTELAQHPRPDVRAVWNAANEALHAEMISSPNINTLIAIILDVTGRPTSLVFHNVGLLGFAISLAFTLGLNRDPTSWDIPPHERRMRANVWWALVACDRW